MLEGLKEAMQYLIGVGNEAEKVQVLEICGETYANKRLERYGAPKRAAAIEASSLSALVDYIKSLSNEFSTSRMIIQIEDPEEESLVIKFKKPYIFEGKSYTEIDLSGMDDLTGADMIAVNKIMKRVSPGIDVMPEVSVEYAAYFASRAAKQPVEFFTGMPPREMMKVKNRVMGFLFGSE